MPWSPSVVVATYNAPWELDLVLTGLARQSVLPREIRIADDGSTEETRALLDRWRLRLPVPLHHHWQEDRGFGKSAIVNATVAACDSDYLCFLDGDTIPHRHWLKDHLFHARKRRVLCGRRVRLGPDITPRVRRDWVQSGELEKWFGEVSRSGDARNYGRGLRLPFWIAFILRLRGRKLMGCNFSLPRASFVKVNGYDEEFDEFGGEDYDLGLRLANAGFRMTPLINRGCAYHLYHPMKRTSEELRALRAKREAERRTWCERGLDRHLAVE
ncbi:MAG: glycosyltransferase [Planctomycetota bacterium]